ncbi:MAG: hypothetical protein ABJE99_01125 [Roseobacter sp.]
MNECLVTDEKAKGTRDMELNWKKLSNKKKTKRTIIFGVVAIAACAIWYDDILQWPRGRGSVLLVACFVGFPLQALFYGYKWYREQD